MGLEITISKLRREEDLSCSNRGTNRTKFFSALNLNRRQGRLSVLNPKLLPDLWIIFLTLFLLSKLRRPIGEAFRFDPYERDSDYHEQRSAHG